MGLAWRFLGSYMAAVFEGRVHWLGWLERSVYRALGTSPEQEQSWKRYAGSLIIFSAVSILLTYLIIRIQGLYQQRFCIRRVVCQRHLVRDHPGTRHAVGPFVPIVLALAVAA